VFFSINVIFSNEKIIWFPAMVLLILLLPYGLNAFPATPSAVDDSVKVDEDSSVTISVLSNDSDVAPNPADRDITIVEGPDHGRVSEDDTYIEYRPDEDFNGTDSFVYRIENVGDGSSKATVTVEVVPINDPPIPEPGLFTVKEGSSVTVVFSATDEDIDPMMPERHPVRFELSRQPFHGRLTGDIKDVRYESPHRAFVELKYIPNDGFRGVESIPYLVEDAEGVINRSSIKIDVIAETRGPISFSGYLESVATFEQGETDFFSDFDTDLTTIYRHGELEIMADSGWSETEWDSLRFRGEAPLGKLDLRSTLDFDPNEDEPFNYWRSVANFYYSEIDFRYTFKLDHDPEDTYHEIEARWSLGDVSFRGRTKFSNSGRKFDESDLRTRWKWPDCDLSVSTDLSFNDEGFEEFAVDVGDIPIIYGTYFEFETTFTASSKEVEPNLFYRSDWIDCFKILAELITNEEESDIEGLSIYGLRFRDTFPEGIRVRIDASLVEDKNSSVTGDSDFSNRWRISGPFDAGYRAPGRWQFTNYLGAVEEGKLFGWGESELKIAFPLAEDLDLETELTYRREDPQWEIKIGGEVSW